MEKSTVIIEKNRPSRWEVVASRRFTIDCDDLDCFNFISNDTEELIFGPEGAKEYVSRFVKINSEVI